jgi:coenzyme F420-reducing hydrogenase alpha subunit
MAQEINLNHITKIEGHAKLKLAVENGQITTCELSATEGARYFEGMVIGRHFTEMHEITSRICGICSCAHVIAAINAVEHAVGITPSEQTHKLRVLLTLAERIRSHATHLYFLALPDYLGYESALAMAPKFKPELQRALNLMRVGNGMIKTLAARDLHPVSAAVGGWLKLPTTEQLRAMHAELESIKGAAHDTVTLFASLKAPDFHTQGESFSLVVPSSYPTIGGTFKSQSASFAPEQYRTFIHEYHTESSSANFVVRDEKRYFVGALARLNNNAEQLSHNAAKLLREVGLALPSTNPFHNNLAQAIELVHSIDEAQVICSTLTITPEQPDQRLRHAGTGVGAVEVPRGTLWHEYTVNEHGIVTGANIITPTAQNLLNIQEDIRAYTPRVLTEEKATVVIEIEKLIRNYDPCFSCSAHFLEVDWDLPQQMEREQ